MATPRRAPATRTDPAAIPRWVLSFEADEQHWMSLVDPTDEPPGYEPIRNPWAYWEARRIWDEVQKAWLAEHAPDLNVCDLWNELHRRAGHRPIHQRAAVRLRTLTERDDH